MLPENKEIINVESKVSLALDSDKKIVPIVVVTFEVKDKDDDEISFFASADTKVNNQKFYSVISSGDVSKWLMDDAKEITFSIDSYPDELHQPITKGLNESRAIATKYGKDKVAYMDIIEEPSIGALFEKEIELHNKASIDFKTQIEKYKSLNGSGNLDDFINRYWFKKHLLIQGEKGVGKTYTVDRKLTDTNTDYTFIAGHKGIESTDLLGYYLKDESGNLVWMDGVLTEAFRKAQHNPCCLFIDEILRIQDSELNILVGSLSPTTRGTFRLRTNRIIDVKDGVGSTELLEVPVENLWCVATTNVGANYQVDEMDEALSDRFRVIIKETSSDELTSILTSCATKNSISDKIVSQMVTFHNQIKDFVVSGELEKVANARQLCEVLQFASDDSEVKSYLFDLVNQLCSTDTSGIPNKAEKEIITKLIKKIFV